VSEDFAVDVGGTFTDLVARDNATGEIRRAKVPTTPSDPSQGILAVTRKADVALPGVRRFFHGTTFGLNTVLEGKGAKLGLITTRGFRDILEIARMEWPMYQLHWDQPEPMIPRYLRREVNERMRADGKVLTPLDEEEVRAAVRFLLADGVESIAVCFLHAYAFPEHEQRVGEILEADFPGVDYTLSHAVTPEYREYERTATTAVDAAIKPRMTRYLTSLERGLESEGFGGGFFVTRCDGGVMTVGEAKRQSVRTLLSGPASGVMGAVALGRQVGVPNLIAIDMGGTSLDAALIVDHDPAFSPVVELSGIPMLMPVIEIASIGAGGGSIAWIDAAGNLNVGPQSASAEPGPVCYGKGGTEPTFTDAALTSGLLDSENFLAGEIALDAEAARDAVQRVVGEPLGLSIEEAAGGIVTVTEALMAAMLEEIGIGKGYDPRTFALVAYGGGGSLVAGALATRLQIPKVIVPRSPATFSAWGMLTLDIVHDFSRTSISRLDELGLDDLLATLGELQAQAGERLAAEGVDPERRQGLPSIDMRYDGQEHTLTIPLGGAFLDSPDRAELRRMFDERHRIAYGYSMEDPIEVVAYRVRAVGTLDKPRTPDLEVGSESSEHARVGERSAFHRESGGRLEWGVYDRELLQAENVVHGPAIVEEGTATTLVAPHQRLTVDVLGNLVIEAASS
jgi:N-methylhydantoinase A